MPRKSRLVRYNETVVKIKTSDEYANFSRALRKVLTVSHSQLKIMLDAERVMKKRKPRRASASREAGSKD